MSWKERREYETTKALEALVASVCSHRQRGAVQSRFWDENQRKENGSHTDKNAQYVHACTILRESFGCRLARSFARSRKPPHTTTSEDDSDDNEIPQTTRSTKTQHNSTKVRRANKTNPKSSTNQSTPIFVSQSSHHGSATTVRRTTPAAAAGS